MSTVARTIPFMWIGFLKDGKTIPQFDLDTGKNHSFKEIQEVENQDILDRFGLFPILPDLARKIGPPYYSNVKLPHFILKLGPNQRLIGGIRTESQSFFSYSQCLKCGFKWQWMPNRPDGTIGDSGLPIYGSEKYYYNVTQTNGKLAFEVICPKCGAKNDLKCPTCDKWWNKLEDVQGLPQEKRTYHLECPTCKAVYKQCTMTKSGSNVENVFLLGIERILEDGTVRRIIQYIRQDGIYEISDEPNYKK